MHVAETVTIGGSDQEALATVMRKMLELEWDIEASAALWVKAKSGSWWEKKVEVEAVVGGGSVTIDAEPDSALGVGPAWQAKVEEAVSELTAALGGTPAPQQERVSAVGVPLAPEQYDRGEWDLMNDTADATAPEPVEAPRDTLTKVAEDAARRGGGLKSKAKDLVWWLVKEAGSALVAIGVAAGIGDGDGEKPENTKQGKLEYDVHSGNMLIRWADGSVSLAPKEYQPHG